MLAHRSNASHWCQPMLCAQASTWVHWLIWLSTLIHKLWWVHSSLPPLFSLVSHWVHYWPKNAHICTWAVSIDAWTSPRRISSIPRFTWCRYIDYALVECDEHFRTLSITLQRKLTRREFMKDEQCLSRSRSICTWVYSSLVVTSCMILNWLWNELPTAIWTTSSKWSDIDVLSMVIDSF